MHDSSNEFRPFVASENNIKITVEFRNPSSNFINPEGINSGSDIKLVPRRKFDIKKEVLRLCLSKQVPCFLLQSYLEQIMGEYKTYSFVKIRKETKKEIADNKKKIVIGAAKKYLLQGLDVKNVSKYTGLKINKIYSIKRKMKERKPIFDKPYGGNRKLKREHYSFFIDIMKIDKYSLMTMRELKQVFITRFHLHENYITTSGLRKALKKKIRLRWKKITLYKKNQINSRTLKLRKKFIIDIIPHIIQKRELIYIDECSFNLNYRKNMGWRIASQRIFMKDVEKSSNYSLMAAISNKKLIGYIISMHSHLTETFAYFLECLIQLFTRQKRLDEIVLIADNATIHRNSFINRVFSSKINLTFLPPYSPELNPIELCWAKWKKDVKNKGPFSCEEQLMQTIYESSKKINGVDCEGWYRHAIRFYENSFLEKSFY